MKVQIFNWAFDHNCEDMLKQLGHQHGEIIEVEEDSEAVVFALAKKLFDGGLNIMLLHADEKYITLGVDIRQFQQR